MILILLMVRYRLVNPHIYIYICVVSPTSLSCYFSYRDIQQKNCGNPEDLPSPVQWKPAGDNSDSKLMVSHADWYFAGE